MLLTLPQIQRLNITRMTPCSLETDSFAVSIGNHPSKCMDNNINHYITESRSIPNTIVRESEGSIKVQGQGTMV